LKLEFAFHHIIFGPEKRSPGQILCSMFRAKARALPPVGPTATLLPGTPLRHVAGVGKLPTVKTGSATAIVALLGLHGAILPRGN